MGKSSDRNSDKKILAAMSGGVDSSVAALLLHQSGYRVTGVTMKLWGGPSDVGCCSVSDVEDARRAADAIGIPHFVFNFGREFQESVVNPYIESHQNMETPNPCIECNRHIKFDVLSRRARALGFDAVATGHYARIMRDENGEVWLARAVDIAKDQSYVLNMLTPDDMERTIFPIGGMLKSEVRDIADKNNLRLARKPDSYEVCFIQKGKADGTGGRVNFLKDKIQTTPGQIVDIGRGWRMGGVTESEMGEDGKKGEIREEGERGEPISAGEVIGSVPALELLTPGQRKGLHLDGLDEPRYVLDIDRDAKKVTVGKKEDLLVGVQPIKNVELRNVVLRTQAPGDSNSGSSNSGGWDLKIQVSAHSQIAEGKLVLEGEPCIIWDIPQKYIAPGQSLVFYIDDKSLKCQKIAGAAISKKIPQNA